MGHTNIAADFYTGHEGEKEISLRRVTPDKTEIVFRLWGGYFEPIMQALWDRHSGIPVDRWPYFLRHWNECTAYADINGIPWQIDDLPKIIAALHTLSAHDLAEHCTYSEKVWSVLSALINFLEDARDHDEGVIIAED